ncbi:MAG: TIM44-like domain-containing protein [Planctomycetes bacterium]|nr:TIM44-like domain-containing protein [Planctomycetota bacterium]
MHVLLRRFQLTGVALLLVCGTVQIAMARAGGGGDYDGGGGGGGGGWSGGSGGGWDSGGGEWSGGGGGGSNGSFLEALVVWTILIIISMLIAAAKADEARRAGTISRGVREARNRRRFDALDQLKAEDPDFEESAFTKRVAGAFHKIQQAWCDHNLPLMRPFVSDGIYERFALQLQEQKNLGYRDHMEDISISNISLAEFVPHQHFEVLTVRICAAALDCRVSAKDGHRIKGSRDKEDFVEFWSFLRRRGARSTPGKAGLMEGECPNCGAPVDMNQAANCQQCDALLRSGEYDWVLAEITQECEWQYATPAALSGVDELCARDPGFNLQHLEDRASVVFWRWVMAGRAGESQILRKCATPEFCRGFDEEIKEAIGETGAYQYWGECAVGSVETQGVLLAERADDAQDMDRALVEVRWAGNRFETDCGGQVHPTGRHAMLRTFFVLGRKSCAATDTDLAVSSAHCPKCGAPETRDESNACEYCGEVLNDGARNWVLLEAFPWFHSRAAELRAALQRQKTLGPKAAAAPAAVTDSDLLDRAARVETTLGGPLRERDKTMLAWVLQVILADQVIDEGERKSLEDIARRHGVRRQALEGMIAAAMRGQLDARTPGDAREARSMIAQMALLAMADGKILKSELNLLEAAGAKAGLIAYDVNRIVKEQERELYRQARDLLRAQRRHRLDEKL